MSRGLLWLALADLGQAWLRSGLAALAIAAAILAVALFAGQIKLHQSEVLASYEAAGAATFIVQLTGVADDEIDALAGSLRAVLPWAAQAFCASWVAWSRPFMTPSYRTDMSVRALDYLHRITGGEP